MSRELPSLAGSSIHKIDEYIAVAEIEPLKNIYRRTMENLLL